MANQNNRNQNQNNQDTDKALLAEIYGSKTFVKIYQALEIGKIKFSFVNKENPQEHIDCYLNADDFASDLIDIIDSGELRNRAFHAKQEQQKENRKYARDIWESRVGINSSSENQLRKFSIQPGTSQEFAFRATQNNLSITVGFAYRELKLLSYRWHFLEKDWNRTMEEKYSMKNMVSEYHQKQNKAQYQQQVEEERAAASAHFSNTQSEADTAQERTIETPTYGVSSSPKSNQSAAENMKENLPVSTTAPASGSKPVPIKNIQLKVKTPLCDMQNGGKAFQGWSTDNKEYSIIIRKDLIENADANLKKLMEAASTMGNKITFKGVYASNDRIYVA